jgi:5-methylcytosine-specific restriction endonuclease McrA
MTPSQAKNAVKKALIEIVDPQPSKREKDALWEHFHSRCAYCGGELVRTERKGHIDHLVSVTKGGSNHISNRVLACSICNGDKKREQDWEAFIRRVPSPKDTGARIARIEEWIAETSPTHEPDKALLGLAEERAQEVLSAFEMACAALRAKRRPK